jgi:Protein of unknown function (DUF3667)
MPKNYRKNDICTNCHETIGEFNYCPNCGQVNSHKQVPLKQILKDLLGDAFTFDSKFFKSIWPLLGKPGHLTNEYINGRRVSYILPLRLYIFTTFLFFFVLSLSSAIDPNRIDEQRMHQITPDSLKVFFKPYSNEISSTLQERLVFDIVNTYKLEKKELLKNDSAFPDSLKKYLLIARPELSDTAATDYAQQLYRAFSFYDKAKSSAAADKYLLTQMLSEFDFNEISQKRFFNWLDENYYYKKVVWKNKNINITFNGEDTAQSAFMREIVKKSEFLFAQGEKGFDLFFSELVRQIPKVMFILLPVFALLLKLFFIRQKIFYYNHLIFALHIHSLIFMYLIIAVFFPNGWVIAATVITIWLHTFLAIKNVYKQKWWLLFLKLNTILFLYFFVLILGFVGLSILAVYFA